MIFPNSVINPTAHFAFKHGICGTVLSKLQPVYVVSFVIALCGNSDVKTATWTGSDNERPPKHLSRSLLHDKSKKLLRSLNFPRSFFLLTDILVNLLEVQNRQNSHEITKCSVIINELLFAK